ncbi:NUDIX domain-containing protein [Streptomyces sp. 35G-GA-8]|uniref:NUDIX domain-containing protein n=1 Tax=Streptomyces sp. 35G-GA-8 TaxID=2939434 RepID=UPI00201F8445|nr:NUDIX domain-containing protein [Streptomyces sp. 35G-GA-8]MCL7378966.1 NUDIX domain-containing protein [Streptomyces sp. 35G-GA-8]
MSESQKKPAGPHAHCGGCGTPYPPGAGWPRTCTACGATAYLNPLPVAVALLPVTDEKGTALVVITRTIEPAYGGLALPGGFVDRTEDWRHAVVRELREETGIEASAHDVRLADALSSPDGHLLLFGLLPERPADRLPPSVPTEETGGWQLLRGPAELAFPLHTDAVRAWFAGRYGTEGTEGTERRS